MNWVAGFSKVMALKGAIASVALSHPKSCNCLTCKAADGDEDAFARLMEQSYLASDQPDPSTTERSGR